MNPLFLFLCFTAAVEACNAEPCPVDCLWADWTDFTSCSATCGGGTCCRRSSSQAWFLKGYDLTNINEQCQRKLEHTERNAHLIDGWMDGGIHVANGKTKSVMLEERKECWVSNVWFHNKHDLPDSPKRYQESRYTKVISLCFPCNQIASLDMVPDCIP